MINKTALIAIVLTTSFSASVASSSQTERNYNYLESGLGVANG
jgi:hypothetical protein